MLVLADRRHRAGRASPALAGGSAELQLDTGDFTRRRLKLALTDSAAAAGLLPRMLEARAST